MTKQPDESRALGFAPCPADGVVPVSRYPLAPRGDVAGVGSVAIGWDRPLRTFFVQVWSTATDEDGEPVEILWEGSAPGEIASANQAIERLRPYAAIPPDLAERLEADRRDGHDRRDGPAQADAKRDFLRRPEHPPER